MKKYIKYAFSRTLPVLFGYIFLGIAFGIVLQQAGFNFIWAFCISLFLYAGSMQFVLVPLLAASASPLTVAITTLFVNSRHVFYGLSFIESFKKMKTQLYMIFSLSDETYSVLCSCKNEDPEEKNRPAWFLINLFDQSYWIVGSVIGALLGQVLPFDFTGIDFSMTALFVVILLDQVLAHPRVASRCAVTGLLAGIICLFIFGTGNFLLPALMLPFYLSLLLHRLKEERNCRNESKSFYFTDRHCLRYHFFDSCTAFSCIQKAADAGFHQRNRRQTAACYYCCSGDLLP